MITSVFNKQTNILESEYIGDVTLEDLLNYITGIKNNNKLPRLLKVKTNAKQANFTFSINDLEKVAVEGNKAAEKYNCIIDTIIIANPETTVISMLYQKLKKNENYTFNIFSTDRGASEWLKNQ